MDALEGLYRPETYVIGFTENRYSSMDDDNSPSPTDPHFGYCSPALDYAERTNKGAENIFHGKSMSLEKERHKSVGKINHNILDLWFELNERRKTPLLWRSFKDTLERCDSVLSDCSSVSIRSSSSEPKLEVQQLPPITQPPVLPEINAKKVTHHKRPTKDVKKSGKPEKKIQGRNNFPKLLGVVKSAIEQNRNKKTDIATHDKGNVGKHEKNVVDAKDDTTKDAGNHANKWKAITEKLIHANKLVQEGSLDMSSYNGRYHTPGFSDSRRRMSYCQCSYDERTEKERMNNIRRRHMSQARTGPLDFNKLRRQITTGRSMSFSS